MSTPPHFTRAVWKHNTIWTKAVQIWPTAHLVTPAQHMRRLTQEIVHHVPNLIGSNFIVRARQIQAMMGHGECFVSRRINSFRLDLPLLCDLNIKPIIFSAIVRNPQRCFSHSLPPPVICVSLVIIIAYWKRCGWL